MDIPKNFQFTFKKELGRKLVFFWYRHYKLLFIAAFLVVLGVGGYIWYESVHRYEWTPEQKQAYIDEYFRETEFKEEKFDALVGKLKVREAAQQAAPGITRDLFTGREL